MLTTLVSRLPHPIRRQIEHRITLLRAAENTGWVIANSVVRLGIAMVVGIWVARYLGAAQYGLYSYAVSLNTLLRTVIPLGMTSLTIRDLAQAEEKRYTILGSSFFVQILVSVVMLVVAIGIALGFQRSEPVSQELTLILSVTLLLMPFEVLAPWFQSQLQSVKLLIANSTSLLLMALARIWLVNIEASLQAFVYLVIVERAINIATLIYLYHRSGESIRHWRFERPYAWGVVREGMPLFWTTMARAAYTRGNEVLLKALANATAVGHYAAASRIAELYMLVPSAILSSATPIISKSKLQDRTLYLKQMTNLLRVTFVIGICSTIAVALIAHWLMPFVYGEEFAAAGAVLTINMWAAIPTSLGLVTGIWVVNEGLTHVAFQRVMTMAVVIVGLNLLLIPRYGAPGAAMSMLVGYVISYIVWDFVDPRMRNFGLLKLHALMPWWFGLKNV